MDHSCPVGGAQRRADLVDQSSKRSVTETALEHFRFQCSPGDVAHHEIRTVGLTPVVVERHDVRVFQCRHRLGLGLESAHELRLIRQLRSDLLDRHLAAQRRLRPAPHQREGALADHLVELIAAQHVLLMRARQQYGVVVEDLMFQALQFR